MAISDADLDGRGWYSVRLRILAEQPECGKSMVVRKRDMGYELISLSGFFGSVYLHLSRNWLARCSGSARCCNGAVARGIDPRVHRQLERNARRLDMESALKVVSNVEHRVSGRGSR